MKTRIILTVLGSDRPGLTQALADVVLAAGGNWLESHLARLGGKYVGSVLVEIDGGQLAELERAISQIDQSGLTVSIVPAGDEPDAKAEVAEIELVGQDRPGIVHQVTDVLARMGANIETFASEEEKGAWSGESLFRARARIALPATTSADQLREALEAISGEIMVDFTFY